MAGTNLMNKLTSLLATVLLLGASPALAGPSPAMSTPELVAATKPAIVLITTYDANGQAKGEGTGFVISTDISRGGLGRVVTNAHIIKDASVIRLTNLTDMIMCSMVFWAMTNKSIWRSCLFNLLSTGRWHLCT